MQAKTTVTVTPSGVRFGEYAFFSHERITGCSAEQLNKGGCSLTARAYMAWVDFAMRQQTAVVGSPIAAMHLGGDQVIADHLAADGRDC